MQIHLTVPITVHTAKKRKLELLPVIQDIPRPSDDANLLGRFLKPGGVQVPLLPGQSALIQSYMLRNKTEALSEDGIVAFTLQGDMLIECLPEVGMTPTEA